MRKHRQHLTIPRIESSFKDGAVALVLSGAGSTGPVRQELSAEELHQLLKQPANQRMHVVALQQLWPDRAEVVHSIKICPVTALHKHTAWCGTALGGIEGLAEALVVEKL